MAVKPARGKTFREGIFLLGNLDKARIIAKINPGFFNIMVLGVGLEPTKTSARGS